MCKVMNQTLTLAELLHDPLTRLMMATDGVSERDHSELWFRVKDSVLDRAIFACGIPLRP